MESNKPKPTILLVHGMWHTPAHYAPLTTALEEKGYTCVTPTLPSGDTPPPEDPPVADVHCIRSIAEGLIDSGRDVVAIAHSYGGIVASEAFAGLGCRARTAEGKRGGVRMLIYVSGFMTTGEETIEALLLLHQDSDWALSKVSPLFYPLHSSMLTKRIRSIPQPSLPALNSDQCATATCPRSSTPAGSRC